MQRGRFPFEWERLVFRIILRLAFAPIGPIRNNRNGFPTVRTVYFQLEKIEKEKPQGFEKPRTAGVSICLGRPKPKSLD